MNKLIICLALIGAVEAKANWWMARNGSCFLTKFSSNVSAKNIGRALGCNEWKSSSKQTAAFFCTDNTVFPPKDFALFFFKSEAACLKF